MGLYSIIHRREMFKNIKQDLLETKLHLTKTILDAENADDIVLHVNNLSNVINNLDVLFKDVS